MITTCVTAVQGVLGSQQPLLVAPACYEEPEEGWVTWVASQVGRKQPLSPHTISGRIEVAGGPAWMYGLMLPKMLKGELDAVVAARNARLGFESGQPLYIGVYESRERYTSFIPVLAALGDGAYRAGWPTGRHVEFQANSKGDALDIAGEWFVKTREREIEEQKTQARGLILSPIAIDLLTGELQGSKILYDNQGTPLVWENLAHGRYGVSAPSWCYFLSCSPVTAIKLAYLGIAEARREGIGDLGWESFPLWGRAPEILGLNGWQRTPQAFLWKEWRVEKRNSGWLVSKNYQPQMAFKFSEAGDYPVIQLQFKGKKKEQVPIPSRWGLSDSDLAAWACYYAVRAERT